MCRDNSTFVECTLVYVCAGLLAFIMYTAFYAHPRALDTACEDQGRLAKRVETVERELTTAREEMNNIWQEVHLHDRNIGGLISRSHSAQAKEDICTHEVSVLGMRDQALGVVHYLLQTRVKALEDTCMCITDKDY